MTYEQRREDVIYQMLQILDNNVKDRKLRLLLHTKRAADKEQVFKHIVQLKLQMIDAMKSNYINATKNTDSYRVAHSIYTGLLFDNIPEFNRIFKEYGLPIKGEI